MESNPFSFCSCSNNSSINQEDSNCSHTNGQNSDNQSPLPFTNLSDNEFEDTLNTNQTQRNIHNHTDNSQSNPFSLYDKYADVFNASTVFQAYNNDQYLQDKEINFFTKKNNFCSANSFSLMHINARSLHKNYDTMRSLLDSIDLKFNVIGISETWMNTSSSLIKLNNYDFVCKGRKDEKIGGGVGMYIQDSICYKNRDDLETDNLSMESIFIEISNDKSKNTIIGVIYRPPSNIKDFLESFDKITEKICKENKHCYILGDFNLDLLKTETNELISQFIDTLYSSSFIPLISKPTRITSHSATLIDNIFTNVIHNNKSLNGIVYSDISDHLPIFHVKQTNTKVQNSPEKYSRFVNEKNINTFISKLSMHQWNLSYNNPKDDYRNFNEQLTNIYYESFPLKKVKDSKINSKPWITSGFKKSIRKKNSLYKKFINSPTDENHAKFKQYRNKLNSLLRKSKKQYYSNTLEKSKSDIKQTWNILKNLLNSNKGRSNYPKSFKLYEQGKIVNNDNCHQISNAFAEYFTNIGKNLSKEIQNTNIDIHDYLKGDFQNSCFFDPTTPDEINKIVSSLKNKNSCGFDDINIKAIKLSMPYLSNILSNLVNLSLQSGIVPDDLKVAKVVPLFKSGDKDVITNYRPVSILPCISKIYEKVVYHRLISYLDKYEILNSNQYGFRNKHSTSMAIVDFVEKISNAVDEGYTTTGIFLDLSKAFDTIDHEILLKKLKFYGIRGIPLTWLENYLTNRKQYVDLNGICSETHNITCGVPQGSILGPLLFLIYINDVSHSSGILKFTLFADDTNVLYSSKDLKNYNSTINNELDKLALWFKTNKLSLNAKKTNYMVFKNSKRKKTIHLNVKIDNNTLKKANETKFLGVIIDDQLKWKAHISHICSKISKGTGIINRVRYFLPKSALKTLYYSLIYPYLHYGNIIWGSTYPSNLNRLRIIQKKVVRSITNSPYLSHTNPLFHTESILKIDDITKLNIASMMYLFHTNQLPTTFNQFFRLNSEIHSHNTRQSHNYHTNYRKTKLAQFSISYVGPLLWNRYNKLLQNCKNIFTFKKLLKEELLSKYQII